MNQERKPGALYFTDITVVRTGVVALLGNYYAFENTAEQRTALLSLNNGAWGGLDVGGIGYALRCIPAQGDNPTNYLILERDRGFYSIKPPEDLEFEEIDDERSGFLMDLRQIDSHWYAAGGRYQVYRRDAAGWQRLDQDIFVDGEPGETKFFNSIDGTSANRIFAVGSSGVAMRFDGERWLDLDAPTNVGFQRVLCDPEGAVYACGYGGALYRIEDNRWEQLFEPDDSIVFWDMVQFQGRTYVCSSEQLFVINGGSIEPVTVDTGGETDLYRLAANDEQLWMCGGEYLGCYDGSEWEQFVFPDNE